MADERPLAAAQRRLGRPGRPRKAQVNQGGAPLSGPPVTRLGDTGVPAVCPPEARLLDVEGAAAYLAISSWTLRDLHAAGRLPRVRLALAGDRECRRLLFDVHDLDQLIEASKDRAP
jgi:hypothetical protein